MDGEEVPVERMGDIRSGLILLRGTQRELGQVELGCMRKHVTQAAGRRVDIELVTGCVTATKYSCAQ